MNERTVRRDLIDPALTKGGWDVANPSEVRLEVPVDGSDPAAWAALSTRLRAANSSLPANTVLPSGIADYLLYRDNGEVLAVVEAKKAAIDPRLAQAQAEYYVTEIAKRQGWRPFAFLSNGQDTYFIDGTQRRLVHGFFSKSDLENQLFTRRSGVPLTGVAVKPTIVNRGYQLEAVRRVAETFEAGKRKALLVMATGTGKTRTAMAICDLFLTANQARRILFIADRDPLVNQALEEGFKAHLPHEPATRLYGQDLQTASRLYVVTLQTMANVLEQFTPAFFDLVIFDEVHRSIFNKYRKVLEYFDARMIGLTATPAEFVDRNTLLAFECADTPDYYYGYAEAIADGNLVDYKPYQANTRFQRDGIRGADLSQEDRDVLTEAGIDPDEIDFSGSDLEKRVSNRDTIRKQWEEIMDVAYMDATGTLIGKTIIFAVTQKHALRLQQIFLEMYPQLGGQCVVITYEANYRDRDLKAFKRESRPRIAITVDMLETGINIPEIVNLVFMKPVQSRIKLDQMIGRGTRNDESCTHKDWLPDGKKTEFLIIDFWQNDFGNAREDAPAQTLPVNVRLMNARVAQLELMLGRQADPEAQRLVKTLRDQIATLPTESFTIKRHAFALEQVLKPDYWTYLNANKLQFLKTNVAPLLRHATIENVEAQTLAERVERLKLQKLGGRARVDLAALQDSLARIPSSLLESDGDKTLRERCLNPDFEAMTSSELDAVSDQLGKYMNRLEENQSSFIELDLRDSIAERSHIVMDDRDLPVYATQYKEIVEKFIFELARTHPVVSAIRAGQPVSDTDLLALERTMRQELGSSFLQLDERNIHRAYAMRVGSLTEFMVRILDLPSVPGYRDLVRRQFDAFLASQNFNADQTRFLTAVQNELVQRRALEIADLYEAPFITFGQNAVERIFDAGQLETLLAFTKSLSTRPSAKA